MNNQTVVKDRPADLFQSDLSKERFEHYRKKAMIAVDTETRGLIVRRDRLCLVQLCDEEGVVSLVRYKGEAPYLKELLEMDSVVKLFHFARFDVGVLKYYLNAEVKPIWCTKIASKLVRTYTDRHSLKELVKEILMIELDKGDQMSDWAKEDLTQSQLEYAANDVRVLIPIYKHLHAILVRESRLAIAEKLFSSLPIVVELDLMGFNNMFEH